MKIDFKTAEQILKKWQKILRLQDYDIRLKLVDKKWRKSGDIKIDDNNSQAILMLNNFNPTVLNYESVIIHELLHLRLWPMDQMIENLINTFYSSDENDLKREMIYNEFMHKLESTVENLTKGFIHIGAENKELPFGYVEKQVLKELK